MQFLVRSLTWAGWIVGLAVIIYGIATFLSSGGLPPLLLSLAVIIAGPLEDLLKRWVRQKRHLGSDEPLVRVVDLATSLVFLLLLLWAQYLIWRLSIQAAAGAFGGL